jgi:multidrug efflux pump subunit AcrB
MRLWSFAVRRWQFASVLFLLLAALGAYALQAIPRQEDPTFPIPLTTIVVVYPGADPIDVERLAVDPIEDAIAELDDVQEIRSTSESGLGVITVQFEWTTDADDKYDEVVREVNALRGTLPQDLREIVFRKANPGLVNIVQAAIVAPALDTLTLKRLADDLEESIESVPGVRRAESWGVPEPEVRIALDLPRMAALGIDVASVDAAVAGEGAGVPAGAVDVGERRYNLKGTGDYADLDEVGDTVIAEREGRPVRLRDIAEVGWSTEEPTSLARFDGARAAFVTANMKDGYSIFAVQAGIDARLEAFRKTLPEGARLEVGFVQARNVADRLTRLGIDFAIALALVSLTLLPLGLRAAGIVTIAIPLSLAMGLAALWALGYSLNQISIAGFVVALGLLVDDAIVVVENIARHLREGADRVTAAIEGTGQIALAVLGCTAVLVLAFLPLLNLPEGAGKFTRGLPLAVVLTVLASMLVAFTIVPFLASRLLPRHAAPEGNRALRLVQAGIHRFYAPLMHRALAAPRRALLLAFALVAASMALVPALGFSLFPAADKPQFLVAIDAADGASLRATDRALRFVEQELARTPGVVHRMANLGRGNPLIYYNVFPAETSATTAEVFVTLERWEGAHSVALLERLRARFAAYPEARITVEQFQNGPPIEAPIAVRVVGPEIETLRRLAGEVERALGGLRGVRDIDNPVRLPRIDLDLGFDRDEAGLLGVPSADLDRLTRLAVAGVESATFRDDRGDAYPVRLRLPIDGHPTPALLEELYFTSRTTGAAVPFAQLAAPRFVDGPGRIQRLDRERMVTVTANIADGFVSGQVSADVYAAVEAIALPPGYRVVAGGEAEAAARSLGGLGTAIIIAAFGILAVLVLEFGGFRSSLIVVGVIPFGILGALLALFLTGYPLSYMAIIGFVALIGVETKNSILLVDFTNQLRREGMALDAAIEKAGEQRFLPVLLTSATAIGGLLPLALSGSALYAPLAIVMIGGLLSSTLLARIVTPVMYKLLPPEIASDGAHATDASARGGAPVLSGAGMRADSP